MNAVLRPLDPSLLRLVVISDGRADIQRLESIVGAAISGGARCVQVREPGWTARQLADACERLRPRLDAVRGVLLVNDRLDVAAARAHGAQIGRKSLPPDAARHVLGPDAVIGYSAHDADELALAARSGCDFALLAPVWPTRSKPGAAPLGEQRAAELTAAATLPVLWLGGVTTEHAALAGALRGRRRPVGLAAIGAVFGAADPAAAVRDLLRAFAPLATSG